MVGKISGVGRDRLIANGRFSLDGLAPNIALKSAAFRRATTGLDLVRWRRKVEYRPAELARLPLRVSELTYCCKRQIGGT